MVKDEFIPCQRICSFSSLTLALLRNSQIFKKFSQIFYEQNLRKFIKTKLTGLDWIRYAGMESSLCASVFQHQLTFSLLPAVWAPVTHCTRTCIVACSSTARASGEMMSPATVANSRRVICANFIARLNLSLSSCL